MTAWTTRKGLPPPKVDPEDVGGTFDYGAYIFVYLADELKGFGVIEIAVHEAVHVFQKAMKYVVEEKSGDEAQAYTIGAIATNILKDYHAVHEEWKEGL